MTAQTRSSLRPLSADEEALIRELGRVMSVLPRAVDADMVRERQLPVSEYTTLMHLSEAPDRLLRMSELAAACNLSVSGMTRVVTRLEERGLVRRVRCDGDARGWNAVLTDAGFARLEEAWPAHLASVRRHVLDHLESADITRLTAALRSIAPSA
ncbi:MarR family winged helix-turn-helix transcriptional regulator [Streptomyces sp. SID3212]|uniref:MarR family winged helix-turn-helix transcriptional regulator n=1 Tax=unclassified Streptomyces TaxID=2593676 RepID=UPI00136AEC66|nr:MarR family winged helix-turn-helix transcriptional regulator [Streptomyces sp. SID3212]MYV52299.1 MarR family transcriptional regulator [Streptomyces sp. SID3212]